MSKAITCIFLFSFFLGRWERLGHTQCYSGLSPTFVFRSCLVVFEGPDAVMGLELDMGGCMQGQLWGPFALLMDRAA